MSEFAKIGRVSTAWQTEQVRVSSPSSKQVASFVTVQSPKLWPLAGMTSVEMVSPQSSQTTVLLPSSVQVAGTMFSLTCSCLQPS